MYIHDDIESMIRYIYESIKHDCERHIMLNRVSLGLPPTPSSVIDDIIKSSEIPFIDLEKATINESDLKGFEPGKFNQTRKLIFPHVTYGKSWFWLNMLLLERYYAEQEKIVISDMSNHNKQNLSNVIWWNLPMFLYAVKKIKDEKLDELSYDSIPYLNLVVSKMILDIDPWRDALRHFEKNYTEDLRISKWYRIYVTKEMCPSMSDDEIKYMNRIRNDLSDHMPHTPNFNNNKPKNSWLERKTKRGK